MPGSIQHIDFSLKKHGFYLWLFQMLAIYIVVFATYILTVFFEGLPSSIIHDNLLKLFAASFSSQYFGQWIEKKHPSMLDTKRIKQLSLFTTLIFFTFSIIFIIGHLLFTNNIFSNFSRSWPALVIAPVSIIFTMTLLYFAIKFSIARGINKTKQKNLLDQERKN